MKLNNEYVLITGGSAGIGLELAKIFAAEGYNLVIVARSEDDLSRANDELSVNGVDVITMSRDLMDTSVAGNLYEEIKQQGLNVTILVNNAGQGQYGLFEDTSIDRELDIIQLNISSVITLTKPFLRDFIARGSGKILNTSSVAGKMPGPWQSVYHGTKAFIQSWTEAIREEVKDKGVTVTALLPGATDTEFFEKADMLDAKNVQDKDSLAAPAKVARDGYDALMRGDDMVISGFKNKAQMAMGKLMSDSAKAAQTSKQQEPVGKDK
ncbi:MAG: SDR family oxidoreductase [Sphingobacteriales bacterium]|nr:MAG: SDR family oxidoreductase [Sphingobacteriales bacterium]